MKRRDLMHWVGLGALASSLPVAIAACQSSDRATAPPPPSPDDAPAVDSTPRADGFAAIGTVAALATAGSLSDKTFQGEQVVVIQDPADASAVVAVNSLCTHQGCSVTWDRGATVFACPCHGSKFNPDGTVASGPATAPLETFEAKIEADLVLVKVS